MNTTKKIIGLLFIFFFFSNTSSKAQEGFIGEIRMFAGSFAPRNWAFCDGQLMSIGQNAALYSIIGNLYGGNGVSTFALPDLRGRVPMGVGTGIGLTPRMQGTMLGFEHNILSIFNLPTHNHSAVITPVYGAANEILLSTDNAIRETPIAGDVPAKALFGSGLGATDVKSFGPPTNTVVSETITNSESVTIGDTGSGGEFSIIQPSTTVNFIICISGDYPARN